MTRKTISVAEAKKHLSELLGRVAYGGEQIVITKRGKPLARLVPATEESKHLAEAKGWLNDEDDFFEVIDHIVEDRDKHVPRVLNRQVVE
jgi:prevent-host-death family protein